MAYCRTCGSLTKTSGGKKGNKNRLKEGVRGRRLVFCSILKLGPGLVTYELHGSNIMHIIMKLLIVAY